MSLCPLFKKSELEKVLKNFSQKETPLYKAHFEYNIVSVSEGSYNTIEDLDLQKTLSEETKEIFKKDTQYWASPEQIPFVSQMQQTYPKCQFIVTGLKSFDSNSRSGEENLNLDYTEKVFEVVSKVIQKLI